MWGFVPVAKPVCEAEFEDHNGNTYACHRAAPYWTAWHIHRNTQNWWIGWPFTNWIHYRPPKEQRMATDQEMQHSLGFNQGRAATYQAIADKGGDGFWTRDAAQAEADKFRGWANQTAQRIAERARQ